ncbi:MAG: Flagellar hook-length control protein FliK [Acidobacteria bacterium]|nr:Flagellar hook-length control protein FliK [Acidobacteriota bacterium]
MLRAPARAPFAVVYALLVLLATCALPAVADPMSRPRLEVKRDGEVFRLFAVTARPDGSEARVLIRESAQRIEPLAAGRAPAVPAAFATWTEAGRSTRWYAITRDGGASWSEPRESDSALLLRDGRTEPGQSLPSALPGLALGPGGRVFLVQLRTPSQPEWRQALAGSGAELLAFFPHNAHLVRVEPQRAAALAGLEFVERVEPFHPAYRLSREVRDWLSGAPAGRASADAAAPGDRMDLRVVAFEWGPSGKERIVARARDLGAEVIGAWPSGHVVELRLTREQARALAALDDVAWIDPKGVPGKDMDLIRQDNGLNWLESNFGYCGTGVRGEVLDAGFEDTHMDFDTELFHGAHNSDSHGTSTFGIVFGNGDRDGDGSAKGLGSLPCGVGIMADYDELGDRFAHTQQLKGAPYFASFQSNSWGNSRVLGYTSYSQEMDDIIWRLDIAILQSQSNAGDQYSRPEAWAKNIVSVGAVNHYDTLSTSDDCWCSGASIGPAEDGRLKPDVAYFYDDTYTTTTGNGYTSGFGGTSGATPTVAGVTGSMIQMWSENVWGTDPEGSTVFERQPHASTIKALLINNANQYSFSGTGSDLTRVHQGWGRPSVRLARERAARSFVIDEEVPLKVGERGSYDLAVELPGTTSATLHRINDLDLVVTSPSGTVYKGNFGLDGASYSLPGGTRDSKNNVENVFVQNPEAGTWRVDVDAPEINQDQHLATPDADAVFALVVTGGTGSICTPPTADFTANPNPARVGQAIAFDSTVAGGAGGPYAYEWDFTLDGTADAVEADPATVFHRPYSGEARLRVRDAANCSVTVKKPVTVTGPDLRYEGYVDLVQVQGNGNGAVDPGEVFDLSIVLRNQGSETATDVTAEVAAWAGNAGPVSLIGGAVSFGSIPANASATGAQAIRFQVGQAFPCGQDATFTVRAITSTDPDNVYPDEVAAVRVLVGGSGAPVQFFTDGIETNRGWSFNDNGSPSGEWQIDSPRGLGGGAALPGQPKPSPDPSAAAEGTRVLGNDLTGLGPGLGNYEGLTNTTATSPPINCSDAVQVGIQFKRWLNIAPNDIASVSVSADGQTWTNLYVSSGYVVENAWSNHAYDVSAWADRNPNFRIRFGLTADNVLQVSGWNIDDIRLTGVTRDSCQPVTRAKPGAVSGLTVQRAGGALALDWATDCGGTSSYEVYRGDLALGYSSLQPEPGFCATSATGASIPVGAGKADFFLVVPTDGGFAGSYGRASDGSERPLSAAACHPRDLVDSCVP